MVEVKRTQLDQNGLIPLLLTVLIIVVAIIYLVFTRVAKASH
jgi:hypothetical protein